MENFESREMIIFLEDKDECISENPTIPSSHFLSTKAIAGSEKKKL